MRVNIEDTVADDGHLRALARIMGWDEDRAMGKLYWVYRETQRAQIASASVDRVVTLCVLRFDSDDECRRFINAMVTAQLAHREDNTVMIRGNAKRISDLADWYDGKRKAGMASAAKRQQFREQDSTEGQQTATGPQQNPTVLSPKSSVFSLKSEDIKPNTGSGSPKPKRKTPSAPAAEQPGYPEAVGLWFNEYALVYNRKPTWNAKSGKQLKNIMASAGIDELRQLIPQFFRGPYPDSIKAGHPLSTGFACLAQRLDMLRADLTHPQRRARAAIESKRLQLADEIAQETDELNRMKIRDHHIGSPFDEPRERPRTEARGLEQNAPHHARSLEAGDPFARGDAQQAVDRAGDPGVVHRPGTVR